MMHEHVFVVKTSHDHRDEAWPSIGP
jgi:hypothetical protein